MMMSAEILAPKMVQRYWPERLSIHIVMAPRSDIDAYDRIPQKPVAPPGLVPHHGSSRSIPISPPSAIAKRNPMKVDGSIEEK